MLFKKVIQLLFLIVICFSCIACKFNETTSDISKESIEIIPPDLIVNSIETNISEETTSVISTSDTAIEITETDLITEKEGNDPFYPFFDTPKEDVIYPYFLESGIRDDYFEIRYLWNDTVPIEGYFIYSDGRITNLEGDSEWDRYTDVAEAMYRLSFFSLQEVETYQTVYLGNHVVKIGENGKLYKYHDNYLLVWKSNDLENNLEYDKEAYHLATMFYDNHSIWYPLDNRSASSEEAFIFNEIKYVHKLQEDQFAGYYIYGDGNIEKYSAFLEYDTAILDKALKQLDSLEYFGAFKQMSLINGLEYEYKLYRYENGLITLNKLYPTQIYDIEKIDVYYEVSWWHPVDNS